MRDAITALGYCAAVCELEAYLCPWDFAELKRRAKAYRVEQLRLLAQLLKSVNSKRRKASSPLRRPVPLPAAI